MGRRISLGPVFAFDWLTTSRRWQIYAVRAFFVVSLLVALTVVWIGDASGPARSTRAQARVGQSFFYAIVGTQLALVLLAAPAATAGALCLDKARGTLAHVLITDLSDSEIVLGKLASRLIPVFAFLLCPLPVLALTTLMGGIDPVALSGAFVMTVGLAVFACSLALLLSVWGSKPHEVLMATYAILGVWLLFGAMWEGISWNVFGLAVPNWVRAVDPFALAFAPQAHPATFWLPIQVLFTSVLIGLGALATFVAVRKMRPVAVRQFGQKNQFRRRFRLPLRAQTLIKTLDNWLDTAGFRTFVSPSLDMNPVLWREWHRNRPSRWLRIVWLLFFALTSLFSALAIITHLSSPNRGSEFGALVVAFSVSVGLLLVSIAAPTSLAEERTRGSLDVLMSTPLPTASIVWGKWWGAFRYVPRLAAWPVVITSVFVLFRPSVFLVPVLMLGLILAQGALATSIGLFLATWISRLGRAMAIAVVIHLSITVGFVMMLIAAGSNDRIAISLCVFSPFWGPGLLTVCAEQRGFGGDDAARVMFASAVYSIIAFAFSGLLTSITLMTFDRRLGRVKTHERFKPYPTRKRPPLEEALLLE